MGTPDLGGGQWGAARRRQLERSTKGIIGSTRQAHGRKYRHEESGARRESATVCENRNQAKREKS